MGFRDLGAFNRALLAKQVWCLLQFPNSLVSRVLKKCYFLDTSLFDAKNSKYFSLEKLGVG